MNNLQRFKSYKSRAKAKGIEFTLGRYEFIIKSKNPCYICGFEEKEENKSNGIDRVDNNKGYVSSNIASCCWNCNRAKNNMSLFEFKTWLNRLSGKENETFNVAKEVTEFCSKYNTNKYEEALCGELNEYFNKFNIKVDLIDKRPKFKRRSKEEVDKLIEAFITKE